MDKTHLLYVLKRVLASTIQSFILICLILTMASGKVADLRKAFGSLKISETGQKFKDRARRGWD